MRWKWLLISLVLAAAPAHSQVRPPDTPRPVQGWLGLDLGEATLGGSALSGTEAAGALRAEIGSMIGPRTALVVNGLLVRPIWQRDVAYCSIGLPNKMRPTCEPKSPTISVNGLSGSFGYTWGQLGNAPRVITSIGAGAYDLTRGDGMTFGADASLKWTLADWDHVALVGTAQAIVLPSAAHGRLWIVPITVGLRRH